MVSVSKKKFCILITNTRKEKSFDGEFHLSLEFCIELHTITHHVHMYMYAGICEIKTPSDT